MGKNYRVRDDFYSEGYEYYGNIKGVNKSMRTSKTMKQKKRQNRYYKKQKQERLNNQIENSSNNMEEYIPKEFYEVDTSRTTNPMLISEKDAEYAGRELSSDEEIIVNNLRRYGSLKYVSQAYKNNPAVVLVAIEESKKNGSKCSLAYASKQLQKDKNFTKKAFDIDERSLKHIAGELKADKEFVLELLREKWYAFRFIPDSLRNDKDFILNSVKINGYILELVENSFKDDEDIIEAAVRSRGMALEFASSRCKGIKKIALAAVEQCGWALEFVSSELKNDEDVIMKAIETKGWFNKVNKRYCHPLIYASEKMYSDEHIIMLAKRNDENLKEYLVDAK